MRAEPPYHPSNNQSRETPEQRAYRGRAAALRTTMSPEHRAEMDAVSGNLAALVRARGVYRLWREVVTTLADATAPPSMPPAVAAVYLARPELVSAVRCQRCRHRLPGTPWPWASFFPACPACGGRIGPVAG